jgi:oligopeptide transport system substrate-binding protein
VVPSAAAPASDTASPLHPVPTLQVSGLQLNWARAPFDDLRARQAFALALDKDRLAQQLGLIPTNHLVPAEMAGYDPRLVGPDGTTTTSGDVAVARRLLQTYADARCGGQFSRCPAVFLPTGGRCGPGDATYEAAMQAAVQMWQQAFPGYPVTGGDSSYCEVLLGSTPGPWLPQAFASGWNADYADAQDALSVQFGPASGNLGSVDVPAANTLLAAADQELDPSQRTALYHQGEQLLVTAVAWLPLGQGEASYAMRPAVTGFALTGLGYPSLDQLASSELVQR